MPYVISKILTPANKLLELVRIYQEEQQQYDHVNDVPTLEVLVPEACKATLDGGEIQTILKVDKEYLAQALDAHNSWIARFSRVEGMRYSIDVYNTRDEALMFYASLMQ